MADKKETAKKFFNINKKYSYFLLSLHRLFILFRSDVSSETWYKYLCIFYGCMKNTTCDFESSSYDMLKEKLISETNNEKDRQTVQYILHKDKIDAFCDNWDEIHKSSKELLQGTEKCITLYKASKTEELFDLLDILETYTQAVLRRDRWDKNHFLEYNVKPYKNKYSY